TLEPRNDRVAYRVREVEIGDVPPAPAVIVAAKLARIDERLEHRLRKERIASRALVEQRRETTHGRWLDVEHAGKELVALRACQRLESHDARYAEANQRTLGAAQRRI